MISFIIPAHNEEALIGRTLSAVNAAAEVLGEPYEVVVANDGRALRVFFPQLDSVELYNPNSTNVDISNWYLTDDRTTPQKFRIPGGASIPANGYRVFTEADWNANPNSSNSFCLNSHGEEIYLYSGDTNGNLTVETIEGGS